MSKNRKTRQSSNFVTDNHSYMCHFRQEFKCTMCPPNKGCNSNRNSDWNSWKTQRLTQWRNKS